MPAMPLGRRAKTSKTVPMMRLLVTQEPSSMAKRKPTRIRGVKKGHRVSAEQQTV